MRISFNWDPFKLLRLKENTDKMEKSMSLKMEIFATLNSMLVAEERNDKIIIHSSIIFNKNKS